MCDSILCGDATDDGWAARWEERRRLSRFPQITEKNEFGGPRPRAARAVLAIDDGATAAIAACALTAQCAI